MPPRLSSDNGRRLDNPPLRLHLIQPRLPLEPYPRPRKRIRDQIQLEPKTHVVICLGLAIRPLEGFGPVGKLTCDVSRLIDVSAPRERTDGLRGGDSFATDVE